jgi:hypothetical protein
VDQYHIKPGDIGPRREDFLCTFSKDLKHLLAIDPRSFSKWFPSFVAPKERQNVDAIASAMVA